MLKNAATHLVSVKRLIRAAAHVACWVPFIARAADSWRGPWRAVGDGARMALESWNTLSAQMPLIGGPNELPHAPHDLGPLEYWLLTIPVHIDTERGVLWGAALLAMLAASLTIEAAYSVRGETGGLLASGVIIAILAWFPSFVAWPFDNPNFAMMFFIAALASCVAVLSGHRRWWPVLVVTASIAAQAYLTFAATSVALVLIAAVTGLVDQLRAKGGYGWLITGLVAGAACWLAPVEQQFTSAGGPGNMSLLLHDNTGPHVGVAFAMKVTASLAAPSSLWWGQNISVRRDLWQLLGSQPQAFGFVVLAVTAASLVIAVRWLRSRELTALAATSLLVAVAAAATFTLIPVRAITIGHDIPLVFVMFAAILLIWLTVSCVIVLAALKLIRNRRGQAAPAHAIPRPTRWAAALLVVLAVSFGPGLGAAPQVAGYAGAGTNSLRVSAALATIERSLPRQPVIALSVSSPSKADRYSVLLGLCWALIPNGYQPDKMQSGRKSTLPGVAVVLLGRGLTVRIREPVARVLPAARPVGKGYVVQCRR